MDYKHLNTCLYHPKNVLLYICPKSANEEPTGACTNVKLDHRVHVARSFSTYIHVVIQDILVE